MLTVNLDSPVPLAEQIRLGIRQAIAAGEVRVGDALPPIRQLAADLGINFNTVARGYRELEQEGLVISRRGRGTVVSAACEATPAPQAEASFLEGFRRLLANARLSGLDREAVAEILTCELGRFWPEEEGQ